MSKRPYLLRTFFALVVIAVFVASMFPFSEKDFYETFLLAVENPNDPYIVQVIEIAKGKQAQDKKEFAYASNALEAAAKEVLVPVKEDSAEKYPMDLVKFMKPVIKKTQKLQTNSDVISLVRKNASGSVRLGIDLNGGAEFRLKLLPDDKAKGDNFDRFRDNAIETIRRRLSGQNIFEAEISPDGLDYVSVRVPQVSDAQKANLEKLILRSARLEFRLVHPESSTYETELGRWLANGGSVDTFENIPPETEFLCEEGRDDKNGNITYRWFLVEKEIQMMGDDVENADVSMNEFGRRQITLSFTGKGATQFGDVTTKHVGRLLAIILDGKLYSAPSLREPILGGNAVISGSFSQDEAKGVADALVSGSLPFTIEIVQRSDIDPSIGKDTVRKSIYSGLIGTALVMIFMIAVYRLAGVVANISLIVNAAIMVGAIAAFDVTLTLPGIAGIILTIGMAVDANVLIYERIREELRAGKNLPAAIEVGFGRAFSAIFDSNLTTLFVGMILYWQGTGAIKGFAVTLAIGIFTTLFTAVFLTRLIFDVILRIAPGLKSLHMWEFLQHPHINFFAIKKITFGLPVIFFLGSILFVAVRGKDVLGIDFTGGTQLLIKYEPIDKSAPLIPASEIKNFLVKQGFDAKATYKKITDSNSEEDLNLLEVVVRDKGTGKVSAEVGQQIVNDLDAAYPGVKFDKQSDSTLGALIGAAFVRSAIIALLCSMLGMILYLIIRFQFSYSIAANIALIHDVVISVGIYLFLGGQITLAVVASVLTLIGYSVNDTIVTFDRQRENLTLLQGKTYLEIVNISINQTLARTILTSFSVALILVCQLIFGGDGIRDFITVMLIGCIIGCYSSIFISPVITAYWHRSAGPNIKEGDMLPSDEVQEGMA